MSESTVSVTWVEDRRCYWLVDRLGGKRSIVTYSVRKYGGDREAARLAAEKGKAVLLEERAAEKRRREAAGIALGGARAPIPIEAAYAEWLALRQGVVTKKHAENLRRFGERLLLVFFEGRDLRTLTRADIEAYGAWLAKPESEEGLGLGRATVKNSTSALRACMNHFGEQAALEFRGAIPKMVWSALQAARSNGAEKTEREPFTVEEAQCLLDLAEPTPLWPFIFAALHTGARKGELLGLHWGNVVLQAAEPFFRVRDVLLEDGTIRPTPKTDNSERDVKLSPELTAVLVRMHKLRMRECALAGEEPGRVFRSSTGEPWSYGGIGASWGKLITRAHVRYGVRKLSLHCFRHTYITLAIDAGENMGWLAKQVGDSEVTIRGTYKHTMKGATSDHGFLSGLGRGAAGSRLPLRAVAPDAAAGA